MNKYIFIIAILISAFIGCSEDSTEPNVDENGSIRMYLVDAPSIYDSVVIFVKQVEVHRAGNDSTSGWYVINSTRASYDLLQLRNGASVVLGDSSLAAGQYTQIRLILDEGNYVVVQGIRFDLTVPSGFQTGIKLNHEFTIQPNITYELLLDFDVDKSIHVTGNGQYMMNPVIRVMPLAISGSISGQVLPADADATVFTTIGDDTLTTYPSPDGFFQLLALPEGEYNLNITAGNTAYMDTTIFDISVQAGEDTDVGTIQLREN